MEQGRWRCHVIRLCLRFAMSYRDVEEVLDERGVEVSCETVRRRVLTFGRTVPHRGVFAEAEPGSAMSRERR